MIIYTWTRSSDTRSAVWNTPQHKRWIAVREKFWIYYWKPFLSPFTTNDRAFRKFRVSPLTVICKKKRLKVTTIGSEHQKSKKQVGAMLF